MARSGRGTIRAMASRLWRVLSLGVLVRVASACASSSSAAATSAATTSKDAGVESGLVARAPSDASAGDSEAATEAPPADDTAWALLASCAVTAPASCPDAGPPHYSDVAPILAARCVPCHSGATGPWPLTDYQDVADWADAVEGDLLS